MCSGCRRLQCILLLAALTRALDETGAGRSLLRFRPLLHAGFCSGGGRTAAAEEPGCPPTPSPPARGARMACYLVISSRHLSNGHYRGIKGVFRGPLCKKGARSPDYAEKEKAAAKALEDVKANFYCELCDKQYHKHQEFDNHINSYDHAHKQRLKDLKQREFARNVASKSWKDEKKQEKALKRLHQLAELRKQSECITGSGPLLKAPRLVLEKQQSPDGIFLYKGSKFTANSQRTITSEGQGFSKSILEKQQLIISRHHPPAERHHALGNHISQMFPYSNSTSQRAGVSFSFSKKVPLKLESSASVFSENCEEGNDYSESPNHKKKQTIEGCHSVTLLEEQQKASLDKEPFITQDQMDLDNSASSHVATKPKMLKENEKSNDKESEEKFRDNPSFSKVKIPLPNFSASLRETEKQSKLNESEQFLETPISSSCQASNFCTQLNTYKPSNAHLPAQLSELPRQPAPELTCSSNINESPGVIKRERSLEITETTDGNMETLEKETMVKEVRPQALPFLHVVSKDGTTALQWPTELLLFTKTEPCISYGCNPLYFDFRLSLNHREGKQNEINKASCKELSKNKTADEYEPSGLIKHKQMSNEQDNQLLKPKKTKGSLNPRKAKQKAESDIGKEMNKNGQKCIADNLNENIPKVPAYLDVSQKDYVTEKRLYTKSLRRPLKHHFHDLEVTELEAVFRVAQLNIEDVQDINFYKAETGLNTADVDISILAKGLAGVEAATNPKVVPLVIQEAVKDHLAAEYQDAAVQDPQSKNVATCSSKNLAKDICGKRKSMTAKLLLERVQSKKTQEQMYDPERFSISTGIELKDHSQSHFALQFSSSVDDTAMLPLPEKVLSKGKNDMRHNEISLLKNSVKKNNTEASEITNVTLSPGTDYDHCVLKDIIQIETGYQNPSIKRNTAIKEQTNLFISEVQPFIQSCDPVPNDFPGAFPSNRYSVANSTETKEELHDVNMDLNRAEGSSDSFCDSAMQRYGDTLNDLEVYSKPTSPPLTQQPITFTPEEVDKYRLLQLQAQQHIQKQLLAKHLKVLPAPGPAAFSATPAVPALPVQQQATVTTIHHTLLQRFAVSASVHSHGSHLSLAPLHPLSQAHFAPISLSPLAPALIPTHPAFLTGHPLHLVSATPLHPSPLTFPALPHAAYIPALFTPHLNTVTPSAIHPNHLVHPLFQGQEPHHYSCSIQTQQLPTAKEVFSVSSYLN
ncbi:zinc finger protein 804B [Onychostruthus taczanowskii]|uniref:zinc finger protein 804B n=1 Tax=Onychostruthus taczanowskii TaxID=356909 RepID=UPI001B80C7FD|nr:zinc finger protein 804B [Onychostruthus taczanowskii]